MPARGLLAHPGLTRVSPPCSMCLPPARGEIVRHSSVFLGVLAVLHAGPACEKSEDGDPGEGGSGGRRFTGGPAGDDPCSAVFECLTGCADAECSTTCNQAGTEQAQRLVGKIAACGLQAQCADLRCTTATCGDEVDACLLDGSGGLAGECARYRECVSTCSDEPCRGGVRRRHQLRGAAAIAGPAVVRDHLPVRGSRLPGAVLSRPAPALPGRPAAALRVRQADPLPGAVWQRCDVQAGLHRCSHARGAGALPGRAAVRGGAGLHRPRLYPGEVSGTARRLPGTLNCARNHALRGLTLAELPGLRLSLPWTTFRPWRRAPARASPAPRGSGPGGRRRAAAAR